MTDDVYPQDAVLVCVLATPLMFADNKTCPCQDCGQMVQYRPYVPDHVSKLCAKCTVARMKISEAAGDTVQMGVTTRALEEAVLFSQKGRKQ